MGGLVKLLSAMFWDQEYVTMTWLWFKEKCLEKSQAFDVCWLLVTVENKRTRKIYNQHKVGMVLLISTEVDFILFFYFL